MSNRTEKKQTTKISPDLLPVTLSGKTAGTIGYFNVWIGIGIIIATFAVGGEAAYYCNLKQIAFAAIFGTFVLGCFFCISSDIGTEHGLSFPVYVTAILGKRGTMLPNALRTIMPYWMGVCICGLIGAVIQPWVLVDHIGIFLTITGSLWSTMYGMTIVDFFITRKRKINVPDLYKDDGGQYAYAKGFNPAGFISFLIGLGACMLMSSIAFIAGSVVSGVSYYILMKCWILKKYPQKELGADKEKYTGISHGREWVYNEDTNSVDSSI